MTIGEKLATTATARVRDDVAGVLGADVTAAGPDDNLLDLGLDSVRLMLLTQRWQDEGIEIDFTSLGAEPTLARWEGLLAAAPRRPAADPGAGPATVCLPVVRVEQLTPGIRRITLAGEGAERFAGTGPGGYATVRLPDAGSGRQVTVRHHGGSAEIDLDVVVHDGGPLGRWAMAVQAGSSVELTGPYPGMQPAGPADWTLLVADRTGLAALAHRVERARAGNRVVAVAVVPDAAEERLLPGVADLQMSWVYAEPADAAEAVLAAVRSVLPADGRGQAWIAGEESMVTAVTEVVGGAPAVAGRCVGEIYWRSSP